MALYLVCQEREVKQNLKLEEKGRILVFHLTVTPQACGGECICPLSTLALQGWITLNSRSTSQVAQKQSNCTVLILQTELLHPKSSQDSGTALGKTTTTCQQVNGLGFQVYGFFLKVINATQIKATVLDQESEDLNSVSVLG